MKVAIVKLSALGDIVHAMVVLQFIKKYSKEIIIDWVVEESYKDLLDCHPDINKVHTVNIKKVKKKKSIYLLFSELSKVRKFGYYDLVIDMQGLIKSALIARMIPSKITLGFHKSSIRESFASIFYNQTFKIPYDKNIIDRNLSLIQYALKLPLNITEVQSKAPFLFSSKNFHNAALSSRSKNILIIPGASNASKRYQTSKFAKLANLIDANIIVIWGDSKEKILANEIKALSPKVIVSDKLSIESLISLISHVDLVIGPDSGPTHMAWALNIPSIALFGSTPGYRNSCVTLINHVIQSNSIVNPFKINKKDNSINDIDSTKIIQLVKKLI